jgi:hypothetical protein
MILPALTRLAAAASILLASAALSQIMPSVKPQMLAVAIAAQGKGDREASRAARMPRRMETIPPLDDRAKFQRDEILKAAHDQNSKDIAKIQELAADIEKEFKKLGYTALPTNALREVEEIENLAKRIRSRLRRF